MTKMRTRPTLSTDAVAVTTAPRARDLGVAADVAGALRATGYGDLHELNVSVDDGCVILSGRVRSYYFKQLAQASVISLVGVQCVKNEIVVR